MEGEQAVSAAAGRLIGTYLERRLHCRPKRFAVVFQRVRTADLSPNEGLLLVLGELHGAMEKFKRFLDLAAPGGELAGAQQPFRRPRSKPPELVFSVRPSEVGVLRTDGLGVVVPKEERMVVPALSHTLGAILRRPRASVPAWLWAGSHMRPHG